MKLIPAIPHEEPVFSKRTDPGSPLLDHGIEVTVLDERGRFIGEGRIVGRSLNGPASAYDVADDGGKRINGIPACRVRLK